MTEMVIRKTNVMGEDGGKFTLEYYLTEMSEGKEPLYGVEVVKRGPGGNDLARSTVIGLQYNRFHLLELIKRLADGDVTPMCLKEIMEDILEESKYELMEESV